MKISKAKKRAFSGICLDFSSNPLHEMKFLGRARGHKRLISQNHLLKIVLKKSDMRTVENKIEISILSLFVVKKLELSNFFNIFVILAYHNTGMKTNLINSNNMVKAKWQVSSFEACLVFG